MGVYKRLSTKNFAMKLGELESFRIDVSQISINKENHGILSNKEIKKIEKIKEQIIILFYTSWLLKSDNEKYLRMAKTACEELIAGIEEADNIIYEDFNNFNFNPRTIKESYGSNKLLIYHQLEHIFGNKIVVLLAILNKINKTDSLTVKMDKLVNIEKALNSFIRKKIKILKWKADPFIAIKYFKNYIKAKIWRYNPKLRDKIFITRGIISKKEFKSVKFQF